jgi:hypothetical protein
LFISCFVLGDRPEIECDLIFLDTSFPFEVSLSLSKPNPIPQSVVSASRNVAQAASVASIVTVSPGLVTQGSRINALSNILTCNSGTDFSTDPLDWSDSPTQIPLGEGMLSSVDGSVLGNWLIWVSFEVTHTLVARRLGEAKVRYPGFAILPFLFLSTPTARSSVTMLHLGNPLEKTMGALSLAAQFGVVAKIGHALWPTRFGAIVRKEEWHSKKREPAYLER